MADTQTNQIAEESQVPTAEIRPPRKITFAWLVPLIAVIIAGWLVYTTVVTQGPTITIRFLNAEGLEPQKTKIKYKEVELGTVKDIAISNDLQSVIVTAELRRGAEKYLTDQTKFWIAKAHVTAKEVRDLGTLLSGAYIGIDPVVDGTPQTDFIGLERPPAISNSRPGRFFVLSSESLGSLSIGSPVLYREIEVGQVTDYRLKEDRSGVLIDIFIEAPFHELVRENSHFWNASGLRVDISTSGIKVNSDSLISMFLGGVTFDSPLLDPMDPADAGEVYYLYPEQKNIWDEKYTIKKYVIANFQDSVHGLSIGAPVEFKGIKVGEVAKIVPEIDVKHGVFKVKTILAIEPQRIVPDETTEHIMEESLPLLISRGLRAQLTTSSLLTGQLYVNLDFHEDVPPAELGSEEPYPEFPTIESSIQQAVESVTRILDKLEKIPMDRIGQELTGVINNLNITLNALRGTMETIGSDMSPTIIDTLEQFQQLTRELQTDFDRDSPLQHQLQELLRELQMTSRSLRTLSDYLERKPQSLLFGKDEEQQ